MKILIIEDDKHLSHMYATKFNAAGFEVITAATGMDGLEQARSGEFDVIVLDLMLPGIGGIEVLGLLRSDKRTTKTPVIVFTNYGEPKNKEKSFSYGADEFLLKVESTPESLLTTVKKCLSI